jgi:TRAP-type mannitol/chloroaromatic compound transport system substrate-binding protein
MVTAWPPGTSILQKGAERFARRVDEMSEGRLHIQLLADDPPRKHTDTFEMVSTGELQVCSSVSFYWADQAPAGQWFASVPFGLNAQGMNAWLYTAGGLQLWEETYAPFGILPRPFGNTGAQMGGWFKKKIHHLSDIKGLKIRMPGIGGKVMSRAGAKQVNMPGADLRKALQNGKLDAAEWIGPHHDLELGLYKGAAYYYYPGWHEPGSCIEALFHKPAYDALPTHLKLILDSAAAETNIWCLSMFQSHNYDALKRLVMDHGVQVLRFPMSAISEFRKISENVLAEEARKDAMSQKVHQAYMAFAEKTDNWDAVSERAYYDYVATKPYHLKTWIFPPDPY